MKSVKQSFQRAITWWNGSHRADPPPPVSLSPSSNPRVAQKNTVSSYKPPTPNTQHHDHQRQHPPLHVPTCLFTCRVYGGSESKGYYETAFKYKGGSESRALVLHLTAAMARLLTNFLYIVCKLPNCESLKFFFFFSNTLFSSSNVAKIYLSNLPSCLLLFLPSVLPSFLPLFLLSFQLPFLPYPLSSTVLSSFLSFVHPLNPPSFLPSPLSSMHPSFPTCLCTFYRPAFLPSFILPCILPSRTNKEPFVHSSIFRSSEDSKEYSW